MSKARNYLGEAWVGAEKLAFALSHLSESQVAEVLEYLKDQWEAQREVRESKCADSSLHRERAGSRPYPQ